MRPLLHFLTSPPLRALKKLSYWRYMRVVQLNYVLVCCESVACRVEVSKLLALIADGGVTRAERLRLPT
jgi:hypothetical protein